MNGGGQLLKAIVSAKFGSPDVLELKEVEKPVPNDNQVLVKVHTVSANPLDWHLLRGKPYLVRLAGFGLQKPKYKILGVDIAGRVETTGKNIREFKPGDEVFGCANFGGFAEYVCGTEKDLVLKPASLSFEEAAAVPIAAMTALQGLRDIGKIQAGQKVLINGASGGVGTFAVQIAKYFGTEVTAVCSTRNMEMVRSIGADSVIDYIKEDFTRNGKKCDLILDAAAFRSISDYKRILSPKGIYVLAGGATIRLFQVMYLGLWYSMTSGKKIKFLMANTKKKDLIFLKELLETGKIKSVIDRRYKLSETPEAIRYLEEGHARGKVVINV